MKKEIGGKVIGEGTYGCVHDPSLHCETSPSANLIMTHTYQNL